MEKAKGSIPFSSTMSRLKKQRLTCEICAKVIQNIRSKYCSNHCQMTAQYRIFINRWQQGLESGNRSSGRNLQVSGHGSILILEVIDPDTVKTIQVVKPYGAEDYVGRTFRKDQMMIGSASSFWEYLEGQDKPS